MAWLKTIITHPHHACSLARRRILADLSFYFRSPAGHHAAQPETINLYPTDRCNLKCSMCFQRLRAKHDELEIGDWIKILGDINFKPRIHLSGGEPMLYRQFDELLAEARKIGSMIAVTTNGTLLADHARQIVDHRVNSITVSIDGDEKTHDQIRGVPETYRKMLDGLKRLVQIRNGRRIPGICFNSMINFEHPEMMKNIVDLAGQYNVQQVQFIHPLFLAREDIAAHRDLIRRRLDRDLNYWQHADTAAWRLPDRSVMEKLNQLQLTEKTRVKVSVFPDFTGEQASNYYNHSSDIKKYSAARCRAMWNTATILPSGLLESCPDYILGNCLQHGFRRLWNNRVMIELRRRIGNRKFFSVCRACCFFY